MSSVRVRLKQGRERPIIHRHPWVFSGAIEDITGEARVGSVADVFARNGEWLARGLIHPDAALIVRLYTFQKDQALDTAFFDRQLEKALTFREPLFGEAEIRQKTNAYRLVYSESDGLSGLIVDRYADILSIQVSAKAIVPFLDGILQSLKKRTGIDTFYVAADEDSVEREKLDSSVLPAAFSMDLPPIRIRENGFAFDVDLSSGQKTGFFLDQRVNRQRAASYARGRRVLSAYCYTGAFEIYTAAAGATKILGVDRSESALVRARENHALNWPNVAVEYLKADVPEALRQFRDGGETFDLIILDPPRFVATRSQAEKGLRAYKDINLLAMKLLTPGGILVSFSCSGQVSAADFKTMIGWSSVDAGRNVRIMETLSQPPDHPILSVFPESEYLKGVICQVE